MTIQTGYEATRDAAIAARDATIPEKWRLPKSAYPLPTNVTGLLKTSGILSADELALLDLTATELAKDIADKKVTSVAATTAYLKAAAIAQQTTNCLVELFPDEALERAAELDAELERNGPVGPLHGVPVSIKDHINVKGHDSPSGLLSCVGKMMASEDAYLVSVLRDAGAVFYCKTTNPQGLMQLECHSYLGTTTNPHNTRLTPGGSSGGEGAIMGMKASPLGVGTDIGGSIRGPAAFCGLYGFKPSALRLPMTGCMVPMFKPGWEGILGVQGPFGRSVDDLELYMKVMLDAEPWKGEPSLHVRPWRPVGPKKLRIGVMYDNGVVAPVAPVKRALKHTVDKLQAAGHDVVEFKPYETAKGWEVLRSLYWPDGGAGLRKCLDEAQEPMHPLTQWTINNADGVPSAEEMLAMVAARDAFRTEAAAHWHASGVDVVLAPPYPSPAGPHCSSKYWDYTCYWNLVNYPGAIFPTGLFVDPALDSHEGTPRNDKEKEIWDSYDAEFSVGAPLALQVVGYIGHDEETLAATRQIVNALQQ